MRLHSEDRELQIKLVELQIRHQHIASFYTVIVSISASITFSFFVAYLTIGVTLGRPLWITYAYIGFIPMLLVTLMIFVKYKNEIDRLEQQIQNIKKQYAW